MEEYNNFTHFSATAVDPEWDPQDLSFLVKEVALFTTGGFLREITEEFMGRFVAGMHLSPCKSLQECRDGNLKNILAAHIFSVLGGKPQPGCNPQNQLIF